MTLTDISMRFGGQTLYEDVSWQLRPDGHYGLKDSASDGVVPRIEAVTTTTTSG